MIDEYLGNDEYRLYFQDKEIVLNINELRELYEYFDENHLEEESFLFEESEDELNEKIVPTKQYNSSRKIYLTYIKFFDESKKQKEIIGDVANELNIKFKSVEQSIRRNKDLYKEYKKRN